MQCAAAILLRPKDCGVIVSLLIVDNLLAAAAASIPASKEAEIGACLSPITNSGIEPESSAASCLAFYIDAVELLILRDTALPAGLSMSAAPPAIAATAAAAAAAPFLLGTRFIDRQIATVHFMPIQFRNSLLSSFIGAHLDERKAPRSARAQISHNRHRVDAPFFFEQLF